MQYLDGIIDRITGTVEATFLGQVRGGTNCGVPGKPVCHRWSTNYSFKCKPTQRMF
jgi:hypothetical protein